VEISGTEQEKKLILRKRPLKIFTVIEIYRRKYIKCYERYTFYKSVFWMFSFQESEKTLYEKPKSTKSQMTDA